MTCSLYTPSILNWWTLRMPVHLLRVAVEASNNYKYTWSKGAGAQFCLHYALALLLSQVKLSMVCMCSMTNTVFSRSRSGLAFFEPTRLLQARPACHLYGA
jgi:hypothetical protein